MNELDDDTLHAAQYALTIRPTHVTALHLGGRDLELEAAWKDAGLRIPRSSPSPVTNDPASRSHAICADSA